MFFNSGQLQISEQINNTVTGAMLNTINRVINEVGSPFPYYPVNRENSWKKSQINKYKQKNIYAGNKLMNNH